MTTSAADFHRLTERLRLSGEIVTRTALHIGSGGAGELDAADMAVLRDADGYPFIPGSSLKGALRSTIEALIRGASLPDDADLSTCNPLLEFSPDERAACGSHRTGERSRVDPTRHCAVCRLFGSRVVASHVRFSDALYLPAGDAKPAPIEIRDGVAIDRDLRTAYGGQKYDFEVVSPGSRFALEVFVENPQPWLMGLLVLAFDQLHDGFIALGGFSSRGLGRVAVEWSELHRVTAAELLDGHRGAVHGREALLAEFDAWREALARRARGGRDVQA